MSQHVPSLTLTSTQATGATLGRSSSTGSLSSKPAGPTSSPYSPPTKYLGHLQQTLPRKPKAPPVQFDKGGSDFRVPARTTSFGFQAQSRPHMKTAGRMKFAMGGRFTDEKSRSPGPIYSGPSSLGKQVQSHRPAMGAPGFGTSTRDGALKQYAVWSFR